jgi:hypothetical protein
MLKKPEYGCRVATSLLTRLLARRPLAAGFFITFWDITWGREDVGLCSFCENEQRHASHPCFFSTAGFFYSGEIKTIML